MEVCKAQVLGNQQIPQKNDFYLLELSAPEIASQAKPGHFLMLTVSKGDSPFLKRPMGISGINANQGTLQVIYQIKGKGTLQLTEIEPGKFIDVLGPCGNGWKTVANLQKVCLIGGGSGAASLLPLAKKLKNSNIDLDIVLGGRTQAQLICLDEFADTGKLFLATEDGSLGTKGMIDVYLQNNKKYDMVYCCGPNIMMKVVTRWAIDNDLPCQVSLEERMGCGYGVCVGCVCQTKSQEGSLAYKRVCKEGPVFDGREVFYNG